MVTVTERQLVVEQEERRGSLRERVERNIADVLTEFGAHREEIEPKRECHIAPPSLVYGIPMAGVRYYSYAPET